MKHNTMKAIMVPTSERAAATGSVSDCFVCCSCSFVDVCITCDFFAVSLA